MHINPNANIRLFCLLCTSYLMVLGAATFVQVPGTFIHAALEEALPVTGLTYSSSVSICDTEFKCQRKMIGVGGKWTCAFVCRFCRFPSPFWAQFLLFLLVFDLCQWHFGACWNRLRSWSAFSFDRSPPKKLTRGFYMEVCGSPHTHSFMAHFQHGDLTYNIDSGVLGTMLPPTSQLPWSTLHV